jgi:acetate kinase
MSGSVAVINAGSSSVKFALYEAAADVKIMFRGQIEGIGVSPRMKVADAHGEIVFDNNWSADGFDHEAATRAVLATGIDLLRGRPVLGVGHRVVHGGARHAAPILVDRSVLAELAELVPLAPLHQPHNLAPIHAILDGAPHIPQVVCFDTAFHHDQPNVAQMFALPLELTEGGVRRYGFHGLSYEYLVGQLREFWPGLGAGRTIIAHLGNGASLCAVSDGRSVASTMGFTAVDGLMMGTRCGALDPGVLVYLMRERGMGPSAIEDMIYRKSGLLGVSGISSDMRTLRASDDPSARAAIALFVYRIVREIGSLTAALGGLDGIVFSGGIGENDAATRAEVVAGCKWMGAELDVARNTAGEHRISSDGSRISVLVIRTDEEHLLAQHTVRELGLG